MKASPSKGVRRIEIAFGIFMLLLVPTVFLLDVLPWAGAVCGMIEVAAFIAMLL